LTKTCLENEDECGHSDENLRHFYPNDQVFAHNSPGFKKGVYRVSHTEGNSFDFHFQAGAYSHYNLWRDWLCQFATGYDHDEFMLGGVYLKSDLPFWKLLNMSDCQGIITGHVAKELLKDFENHREKALGWTATKLVVEENWSDDEEAAFEPEHWVERYDLWTQAFRVAAPDGIVVFC
jgi:hypothetical protein